MASELPYAIHRAMRLLCHPASGIAASLSALVAAAMKLSDDITALVAAVEGAQATFGTAAGLQQLCAGLQLKDYLALAAGRARDATFCHVTAAANLGAQGAFYRRLAKRALRSVPAGRDVNVWR